MSSRVEGGGRQLDGWGEADSEARKRAAGTNAQHGGEAGPLRRAEGVRVLELEPRTDGAQVGTRAGQSKYQWYDLSGDSDRTEGGRGGGREGGKARKQTKAGEEVAQLGEPPGEDPKRRQTPRRGRRPAVTTDEPGRQRKQAADRPETGRSP